MDKKAILNYLGEDWSRVLGLISSSLSSDVSLLNDTNTFFLEHSGKKLRPLIALIVAKTCGGGKLNEDSLHYAAASELLHNATLLHDDVVDGSETRRGVPTVASLLGGTASVLIGDFWLAKAVETMFATDTMDGKVVKVFTKTLSDLAEGEMLQLQKSGNGDTSEADYFRIIYSKTASLFEAACVSAAISVDSAPEIIEAVREYAVNIGLAFQIKDDILDYSGSDIGKPTGADIKEQKITLPLLGALHRLDPAKEKTVRKAVCDIAEHPEQAESVFELVREYGGVEYATERLHECCNKAVMALKVFPDCAGKSYLADIAEFIADRKN